MPNAAHTRLTGERKRLGRPPIAPVVEKRIHEALATPGGPVCARSQLGLPSILGGSPVSIETVC
jgi:hypothetical protein